MSAFLSPPPDVKQPVVIVNDGGGLVDQYERAAWRYRLEKRRVEIRGSCRSACTLALSVPNVCVGKNAVVKWHHAYNVDTHEPRYVITRSMLAQLPLRVWYQIYDKITINYNPDATLGYSQLVALGVADCDPPAETQVADAEARQAFTKAVMARRELHGLPAVPEVANRSGGDAVAPARPANVAVRAAIRIASLPVSLPVAFFRGFARGLAGKRSN
jgi:hypothetical protein